MPGLVHSRRSAVGGMRETNIVCVVVSATRTDALRVVIWTDHLLGSTNDILDNEAEFHDAGRRRAQHFKVLQSYERELKAVNDGQ